MLSSLDLFAGRPLSSQGTSLFWSRMLGLQNIQKMRYGWYDHSSVCLIFVVYVKVSLLMSLLCLCCQISILLRQCQKHLCPLSERQLFLSHQSHFTKLCMMSIFSSWVADSLNNFQPVLFKQSCRVVLTSSVHSYSQFFLKTGCPILSTKSTLAAVGEKCGLNWPKWGRGRA